MEDKVNFYDLISLIDQAMTMEPPTAGMDGSKFVQADYNYYGRGPKVLTRVYKERED